MSETKTIDHRDLEELARDYAFGMLTKEEMKEVDKVSPELDWSKVFIRHGETAYTALATAFSAPKSHILFSANFTNNTEDVQTYNLKTERRTHSTCQVNLERLYTIGAEVSLQLLPPNPIIEANAGFHCELSVNKGVSQTFEEELTWGVDTNVTVPVGFAIQADLVIKEENYNGAFEVDTTFQGDVLVTYVHKKDRTHVRTVRCRVDRIFTEKEGFKVNKDDPKNPVVTFTTRGVCKCRFGIQQHVGLKKKAIDVNGEA